MRGKKRDWSCDHAVHVGGVLVRREARGWIIRWSERAEGERKAVMASKESLRQAKDLRGMPPLKAAMIRFSEGEVCDVVEAMMQWNRSARKEGRWYRETPPQSTGKETVSILAGILPATGRRKAMCNTVVSPLVSPRVSVTRTETGAMKYIREKAQSTKELDGLQRSVVRLTERRTGSGRISMEQ